MPPGEVKQEPEEPEDDGEPLEVPPGTVLHSLEDLLSRGRALLGYRRPGGAGWGLNGKVEAQWCSFWAEADGVCTVVQGGQPWCTEAAEEWAEEELEWLRRLRGLADRCPATSSPQPSAARPRACRRAVFDFHRAEHRKKLQGEASTGDAAEANAEAGTGVLAGGEAGPQRPKATAKAPVAKAPVAKAPAGKAKAPVVKAARAPAPVAKEAATASVVPAGGTVREFLLRVKLTVPLAGYRRILAGMRDDEDDEVAKLLADHPDLLSLFQKHASATAATRIPKAPEEAAPVDPEEVLRGLAGDAAARLVRLTLGGRGALPNQRLAMLRYLRTRPGCEEAYKQMHILRGPPGIGKSAYALGQLSSEVDMPPRAEDRRAVQLCHVCATDDFCTLRPGSASEEFAPEHGGLELAHARNEARVRLAVQAGVHPIYVDGVHASLWEMRPYVCLAREAGYEASIVEPSRIWASWDSAEQLAERNRTRAHPSSRLSQEQLRRLAAALEPLPAASGEERARLVAAAERPRAGSGAQRAVAAVWHVLSAPAERRPEGASRGEPRPAPAGPGEGEPSGAALGETGPAPAGPGEPEPEAASTAPEATAAAGPGEGAPEPTSGAKRPAPAGPREGEPEPKAARAEPEAAAAAPGAPAAEVHAGSHAVQ